MKRYAEKINIIFVAVYVLLFLGCFISQDVYSVVARFASLITFVVLFLLATLVYVKIDYEIIIVIGGIIVAGMNLILIHSNKGAFFTAADLLLMLYVSGKISFNKKNMLYMSGIGSVILLFWYATVRWDYNFNMAGLVFMVTTISCLIFFELLKEKYGYLKYVQALSYLAGLLFCTLYHSRCAMMGLIIFGIIYMATPIILNNKWLKGVMVFVSTLGAILFTVLYVAISRTGINITILYKDILSGRQLIWDELWQALIKQPITGIGSSYQLKSFFIFEVHNGLFDILAVHGIIVFSCAIVLLVKKLFCFLNSVKLGNMGRIAVAGVFSILFTSFFENFFIVSPYLLVLFFLMNLEYE